MDPRVVKQYAADIQGLAQEMREILGTELTSRRGNPTSTSLFRMSTELFKSAESLRNYMRGGRCDNCGEHCATCS